MNKLCKILILAALIGLCLLSPAWAGDCSGPDDCAAVPDNGTRAAIGGAVLAGIVLFERSRRKRNNQAAGEEAPQNADARFGTADPDPSSK